MSGATPLGLPPPSQMMFYDSSRIVIPPPPPPALPFDRYTGPLSTTVPLQNLQDIRWSGAFEATMSYGVHRFTPGFSYSEEHDYQSSGAAFNYSVDLNEKNTTLNVGWSHNWDKINRGPTLFLGNKNSDDVLVGVNQILGPKTVLTVNFTYGNAHGFLNDPYKYVRFDAEPQFNGNPQGEYENRPRHRHRYIGYVSLTQYVSPLRGSAEGSYRFFHDSYGINAHTVGLTWYQKIGKRVTVSPLFRYYRQGAADFYVTHLAGYSPEYPAGAQDPSLVAPVPAFYSADYRLSEMETFTYGITANVKVTDWLTVDVSYKRYEMFGLDSITSASAYPKAHVVSVGARVWF